MEKIYMQDEFQSSQSSSQSSRSQSKMFHFSVALSFFVAIFAVVSLVAAGFNQISYAAPSNLTFYLATDGDRNNSLSIVASTNGSSGIFNVPIYLADSYDFSSYSLNPLLCVEHNADVEDSSTYTKAEAVTDQGLLYILNKSAVINSSAAGISNGAVITTSDTGTYSYETNRKRIAEIYATQVAIWVYMNDKYASGSESSKYSLSDSNICDSNCHTSGTNKSIIENATELRLTDYESINYTYTISAPNGTSFYNNYIRPVVEAAKNYASVKNLSVTKANNTFSKVGDNKYYQSAAISVTANPSDDLKSYEVTLSGVDGAFVVNEKGERKTGSFNPGEKFFVRVPIDKVSNAQKGVVDITVKGKFSNYLSGSFYTSGNLQKVVVIEGNEGYESATEKVDFVGSPNTGMNQAQTIYFIGLIVLLCGVGIIYANAKPVEVEE